MELSKIWYRGLTSIGLPKTHFPTPSFSTHFHASPVLIALFLVHMKVLAIWQSWGSKALPSGTNWTSGLPWCCNSSTGHWAACLQVPSAAGLPVSLLPGCLSPLFQKPVFHSTDSMSTHTNTSSLQTKVFIFHLSLSSSYLEASIDTHSVSAYHSLASMLSIAKHL